MTVYYDEDTWHRWTELPTKHLATDGRLVTMDKVTGHCCCMPIRISILQSLQP